MMAYTSRNEKFRGKSTNNVTPIGSIILDLPPSCIEFVPVHGNSTWPIDEPCFVVGTYDLQKEEEEEEDGEKDDNNTSEPKEQSRQGSLSLFKLKADQLTQIQSFRTPSAVLDLHFYPGSSFFAVASSTGTISVYMIHAKEITVGPLPAHEYSIIPIVTHQVFRGDTIITSFAWDSSYERDGPRMAVTSNSGAVNLLKFNRTFTEFAILNGQEPLSQHSYEAWCTAFSPSGHSIWSGGDDSKLRMARLQPGVHKKEDSIILLGPKEHASHFPGHNAGVTAILPIPIPASSEQTNLLLTGSYDDHIRVYALQDTRPHAPNSKPKALVELDIGLGGGGVWKLKFLEEYQIQRNQSPEEEVGFRVLASCMRVGAKILEVRGSRNGDWSIAVLAKVGVHESMNYASDMAPIDASIEDGWHQKRVVVSTSFYDRLLFVWRFDPLAEDVKVELNDVKVEEEEKTKVEQAPAFIKPE